jgi:hypothetical protein
MLYIDLLEIKTADDLCKRMIKALISLEQQAGFIERVMKTLSYLRPVISIDPITGHPSVSVDAGIRLKPDSLDGILDLIRESGRKARLVVVFDEFQDVLNLADAGETLAVLRSKIQFHKAIPYIFTGSIRNQMAMIFADPKSAFFKSAVAMEVGPLNLDAFADFLSVKFAGGKRLIGRDVLMRIIGLGENVPGDIQELCGAVWELTSYGDKISESHIGPALELIYARESKGYESVLVQVTGQQLKCLTGLASMGGKAPLSASFISGVGNIGPASIKKALNRLIQLKVIYRHDQEYKFVNPFFKAWLLWKNY